MSKLFMTAVWRRIRVIRCCEEEDGLEEEGVAVEGWSDSRGADLAWGLLMAVDEAP